MNSVPIICLVLIMSLLSAGPALATEPPKNDALDAYEAGKAAFDDKDYAESATQFRRAYDLRPSWKIYYNIGQAEAAGKRYGLALAAFERYLAEGGDEISVERQDAVMQEIVRLRNLVGYVRVTAPQGAEIWMDGVKRGVSPVTGELPVAASVRHQMRALNDGVVVAEKGFQVTGGRTVDVRLEAATTTAATQTGPAPAETTTADETPTQEPDLPPEPSKTSGLMIAGWTTAGIGVATLVAGAVTAGLSLSKENALDENCDGSVCPETFDYPKTQTARDRLALATDVLLPVGGVVTAAGVSLLVIYFIRNKHGEDAAVSLVQPVIAPDRAGLMLKGRF